MTTLNLFLKSCPKCAATLTVDAKKCDCGYRYEPQSADRPHPPSEELVAKAEALYEYYLTARTVQALNVVKTVKLDLARNPDDPELAMRLKRAEQEAQTLQAKLAAQTYKTAEARKTANEARSRLEQTSAQQVSKEPPESFRALQEIRGNEVIHDVQTKAIVDTLIDQRIEISPDEQLAKAEKVLRAVEMVQSTKESEIAEFITEDELNELKRQGAAESSLKIER